MKIDVYIKVKLPDHPLFTNRNFGIRVNISIADEKLHLCISMTALYV